MLQEQNTGFSQVDYKKNKKWRDRWIFSQINAINIMNLNMGVDRWIDFGIASFTIGPTINKSIYNRKMES